MFSLGYLILVLVAAVPLARTVLQHWGAPPSVAFGHRLYRDLAYIAAAIGAIILLEMIFTVSLQNYWFGELGQQYRYWFALGLRAAIFTTVFVLGGLFVGFNLRAACRPVAIIPRSAPWFAGFILSAVVALGAIDLWTPLTAFLGATPSGVTDAVFGTDLSFYLLALPFYEQVVDLVTALVVITIVAWAAVGFLFYLRPALAWRRRRSPDLRLIDAPPADGGEGGDGRMLAANPIAMDSWLAQGMALAALFCLDRAVAAFLERYHLVIRGHSAVVAGASWIDTHVWLPAYAVIIACWVTAAVGLAAAAGLPRLRRRIIAVPSHWAAPLGVLAFIGLAAGATPSAVERLYVGPNQITLEQPYLVRSIAGTRRAYGLDGPDVEEQAFAVSANPIDRGSLERSAATLRDARIWDWRALEPQLQQTQGLRPYYSFGDVDFDRYQIDGVER